MILLYGYLETINDSHGSIGELSTVFGKSLEAESSLSYKQIALRLFCM